jgi:hypothetical protein
MFDTSKMTDQPEDEESESERNFRLAMEENKRRSAAMDRARRPLNPEDSGDPTEDRQ